MALNDVNITKGQGLGRAGANDDRATLFICGGITIVLDDETIDLNTLHGPFYSVEDAEAKGITAAFDEANKVLIHHHIVQFFRPFGENVLTRPAKPLYLYMVSQSTPLSMMCDKDETNSAFKAVTDSNLTVKRVVAFLNPNEDYTPDTNDNGFDADVVLAAAKAQECAEALYALHGPVHFYIEGRDLDVATAGDALDLRTLNYENVSIVFVQDLDVADSDDLHNGYAAVGAVAGLLTSKPTVADSFAEVGLRLQGNLQDKANGYFLRYGFGQIELKEWSIVSQGVFYDKHYIVPRIFAATEGVYINQSFTCANDSNDFIFSELNEVHNKAHRELYKAYVPYINTKVKLRADGTLPAEVVKDLEGVGNNVLATMANNDEISAGATKIDPSQIIVVSRKITVKWNMVPMGKTENIDGELSFGISLT